MPDVARALGGRRWWARCVLATAFACSWALTATGAAAHAQDRARSEAHVEPPPAPEDREPALGFEVHVSAIAPIANEGLCPPSARCVFGGGGGVGGSVERRFATGFAIALGYDALFVDAAGVYEIGVIQFLRAAVRFIFFPRRLFHLVLDAGAGALVFGETFRVAAVGGALQFGIGGELEVTHAIAFTAELVTRVFTTTSFTSPTDGVRRSEGAAFDAAVALQLGVQIVEP